MSIIVTILLGILMSKAKRVILYGRSVLLGAVSSSLLHYLELEIVTLTAPLETIDTLYALKPDAIIYDLDLGLPDLSANLLGNNPELVLIGIDSATDQMILGSGEQKHVLQTLDLVNEIMGGISEKHGEATPTQKMGGVGEKTFQRKVNPIKINQKRRLTLIKLAWRNLFTHTGRTILSVLGISIGVAAILATNITNHNVSATLDKLFERTLGGVELQVIPLENKDSIKESTLGILQHFPEVVLAVPTVKMTTVLPATNEQGIGDQSPAELIEMGGASIEVMGIDPVPEQKMRVYTLLEGVFPVAGEYKVVIPKTLADQNDYKIGKHLILFGPEGTVKLQISGILADEGAAKINAGNVVFIPLDVVQDVFSLGNGFSEINLKIKPDISNDPRALEALKTNLTDKLSKNAQVIYPTGRADQVPRMSIAYQFSLTFFSIMALFMGAFLIYNTFTTTVLERTQEIGILRAIGFLRRQVIFEILLEAGFLSILGCALGVFGGVLLSRTLMLLMRGFFEVESLVPFSSTDLLISIGVGTLGTLFATLLPARKAARISSVEAFSFKSRSDQKTNPVLWKFGFILLACGVGSLYLPFNGTTQMILVVRMAALILLLIGAILTIPLAIATLQPINTRISTLIFGEMGSLGSRNIQRVVIRTMATIAALAVSLIMIVEVSSLVFVLKQDVSNWLVNALGADLIIKSPYPMQQSFARELQNISGVKASSPTRVIRVQVGGNSQSDKVEWLYFMAIDPDQFRQVGGKEFIAGQGNDETSWSLLQSGNSLFISSVVAEMLGIGQGDTLTLRTRRGLQDFIVRGVTTEFDQDGLIVTGTYDVLRRMFGESGVDYFLVKVSPGYDADEVANQIKVRYEKREGIQIQSSKNFRQNVMTFYNNLTSLFNVLSWLGVIIGTLGLVNTMTINILERKRELAMFRAQGCLRRQIARMVLSEALIIGMLSALYGIVFGFILSHGLVTAANLISGYDLQFMFSVRPYALILVIALGVSQLATLAPARKASQVNVIEALKQE